MDLTPQLELIYWMVKKGHTSPKSIRKMTGTTSGTVSNQLTNLEEMGYIKRIKKGVYKAL